MLQQFVSVQVPLWALLAAVALAIVASAGLTYKFGSNWLTLLAYLFTPADMRALAILLWRSGVMPMTFLRVRFPGGETQFADYVANQIAKLFPDTALLDMAACDEDAPTARSLSLHKLTLQGRDRFELDATPRRADWPVYHQN